MRTAVGRRALSVALGLVLLLALVQPAPLGAQTPVPQPAEPLAEAWLEETLAHMTTADKVGQLFLVTFDGSAAGPESDIARLVQVFRVGGVILSPQNGNWLSDVTAPEQVSALTTALQTLAFTTSLPVEIAARGPVSATVPLTPTAPVSPALGITSTVPLTAPVTTTVTGTITLPAQGVPLLLAVSQEGDGYPYSALHSGFTELPSSMAVGATWNDINAETIGWIAGSELSAVGVNFLLGPSLDVLSTPRPGASGDLGTRVFGGDPYWVGKMGRSYIRGVHRGSAGRVAVAGKHLPGLGASDRSLEEEVSTVDRSLDTLRLIELQPFFAVTQAGPVTDTVDALMTAHIRYRGFQGNIRYVTRPLSLDQQGLQQILAQAELAPWRGAGGVLISDALGVPAIRRYYDPKMATFPNRQIAMEAFQAGNDLLNLSRFSLTDSWPDQLKNVEDTILFFRERYDADDAFRARVDQSVRRILRLKRRLCANWSAGGCLGRADRLDSVGASRSTVAQVAQSAVTLLSPPAEELPLRLPRPPRFEENVLLFTDARQASECAECQPFVLLDPKLLRDTMLRMYGPGATGQLDPQRLNAFSLAELRAFLDGEPDSRDLEPYIEDAQWIVFGILDDDAQEYGGAATLKRFLREQTAGLEAKNVIVMAYGAPYYLDATEVSKLTAYYGLYSKTQPFIEASVQALFQEFAPGGRPPVTVDGVGYALNEQLRPDPAQVIEVLLADQPAMTGGTPAPPTFELGDPLRVRTGVIVDRNGNPVPDGTPVNFNAVYVEEGLGQTFEATTVDGVAETTVPLERAGLLQISASSDPALNSRPLEARTADAGRIIILTATPGPTNTPTATPEPTDTPSPTPTITPSPTSPPAVETTPLPPPEPRVRWADLLLALLGMGAAGTLIVFGARDGRLGTRTWNPPGRGALWSVVCGLLGYLLYGMGLPGTDFLTTVAPGWRGLAIGFACGLLPLAALAWRWVRHRYDWEARAFSRR